jgi:hypothetical protein
MLMLSSSETSVQITNALEKLIDSGISLGERVLGINLVIKTEVIVIILGHNMPMHLMDLSIGLR